MTAPYDINTDPEMKHITGGGNNFYYNGGPLPVTPATPPGGGNPSTGNQGTGGGMAVDSAAAMNQFKTLYAQDPYLAYMMFSGQGNKWDPSWGQQNQLALRNWVAQQSGVNPSDPTQVQQTWNAWNHFINNADMYGDAHGGMTAQQYYLYGAGKGTYDPTSWWQSGSGGTAPGYQLTEADRLDRGNWGYPNPYAALNQSLDPGGYGTQGPGPQNPFGLPLTGYTGVTYHTAPPLPITPGNSPRAVLPTGSAAPTPAAAQNMSRALLPSGTTSDPTQPNAPAAPSGINTYQNRAPNAAPTNYYNSQFGGFNSGRSTSSSYYTPYGNSTSARNGGYRGYTQ